MTKIAESIRELVGFKTRYGFNSYDKTVPLRQLGYHLKRKIFLPETAELSQENHPLASTRTLQRKTFHLSGHQEKSLRELRVSFLAQKEMDKFIADTGALESLMEYDFLGEKYNVLPASPMLKMAVAAGYTIFEVYQVLPTLHNCRHRGRRLYWLVKDDDDRSILIEDYLDSKHCARLYFSYLHADNFSIFKDEYKPILWHQHAVLNHQYNTKEYMIDIFKSLLEYLDKLHGKIVSRALDLEKNWFGSEAQLLKLLFDLRCENDVEKSIAYALKLAKNPNFQSYKWTSKLYAIRYTILSGRVSAQTKKGDEILFDKPLWGEYPEMDDKMDEIYGNLIQ